MKKINLLVDARIFGGEGQGTLTYISGLYHALLKNYGDDYNIYFASYDQAAVKKHFKKECIHFIPLKSRNRLWLWLQEYPNLIRKYDIDFAHFQYITPFIKNCRFIVTTHDVLFNDFAESFSMTYAQMRNILFKHSLKNSDIRLTVSEYSKNAIHRHYGIPTESIQVTPNAPMDIYLKKIDRQKSKALVQQKYGLQQYILYVSRIEKRKNQLQLLKAYTELKLSEHNIQLVFVGNDTLNYEAFSAQIKNLKGQDRTNVHWISDWVSNEDLTHIYNAAQLFVYPSKAEGYGIPPIESAVLGINTICSKATAMQDYHFFGDNHIDTDNLELLKACILKNLRNPTPDNALQKIAQTIQQKYTWNHSATVLHQNILQLQMAAHTKKVAI